MVWWGLAWRMTRRRVCGSAGRQVTVLEPSWELCGTTPAQFADLLARLAPLVEAERVARGRRPDRKRKLGGRGDKPNPFWFRLLVALTLLRQGSACRATARIFSVHERTVRKYRDEIVGLLAAHGCQPPGAAQPIRTLDDLRVYLDGLATECCMVDGTHVPRSMPVEFDAQRAAYSGKTTTTSPRAPSWATAAAAVVVRGQPLRGGTHPRRDHAACPGGGAGRAGRHDRHRRGRQGLCRTEG